MGLKIKNLSTGLNWTTEEYQTISSLGDFEEVDKRPSTEEEIIQMLTSIDYAILPPIPGRIISEKVFQSCKQLKGISLVTTRYFWLDIESAKKNNIVISNLGNYSSISVAELAIGLMFDLMRKITLSSNSVKKGNRWFDGFRGFDLRAKTLGVIGAGYIGQEVLKIASGIGMNTIAFNRTQKTNSIHFVSLEKLLSVADVVIVCLALNDDTLNFLNKRNITLLKKGSCIINISPENLIDQEAVYGLLITKHLSGYAFEVDERRTYDIQERLLALDEVIATPHTGWYTFETEERFRKTTIENLKSMIAGNPINQINY